MITHPLVYLLNTHGVILLYIVVLGYFYFVDRSRQLLEHILISAVITTVVILLLKEVFNTPRPYQVLDLPALAGYSVRTASLPSLHAAWAFSLGAIVISHKRKFGILLFLTATLVSYGRVAANVHYPIDVMLGSIVGVMVSFLVERIHLRAK